MDSDLERALKESKREYDELQEALRRDAAAVASKTQQHSSSPYEQKLEELKTRKTTLEKTIEDKETEVFKLERELSDLQQSLKEVDSEIKKYSILTTSTQESDLSLVSLTFENANDITGGIDKVIPNMKTRIIKVLNNNFTKDETDGDGSISYTRKGKPYVLKYKGTYDNEAYLVFLFHSMSASGIELYIKLSHTL